MKLPQFIARALSFFESAETRLANLEAKTKKNKDNEDDEEDDDEMDARVTELQGQLATAQTRLTELQGQVSAKDTEITKLKQDVETEKKRAHKTIAGQGLNPDLVPPVEPAAAVPGQAKETAWNKYCRLQAENPREAGAFWAAHADEILASRT